MKFKLIMALVGDSETDDVLDAGRRAGATGATIITSCRGEGLIPGKTFFGLDLSGQRDILLFLVEEHLSRDILEPFRPPARSTKNPAPASPSRSRSRTRSA